MFSTLILFVFEDLTIKFNFFISMMHTVFVIVLLDEKGPVLLNPAWVVFNVWLFNIWFASCGWPLQFKDILLSNKLISHFN